MKMRHYWRIAAPIALALYILSAAMCGEPGQFGGYWHPMILAWWGALLVAGAAFTAWIIEKRIRNNVMDVSAEERAVIESLRKDNRT
jgi:hypothetical protein